MTEGQEKTVVSGTEAPEIAEPSASGPVEQVLDMENVILEEASGSSPIANPSSTPNENQGVEETLEDLFAQSLHATQIYPTSIDRKGGSPDEIAIPGDLTKRVGQRIQSLPQIDLVKSPTQAAWASTLQEATTHGKQADFLADRLEEKGSSFVQAVDHKGNLLRAVAPKQPVKSGTEIREGELAVMHVLNHFKIGGLFRAPMWNSGFWVTFKPATDTELFELNRIIATDKYQAGRWSYGLSLTNNVVYTLDRVLEFILDHVYSTSISQEDLPISKLLTVLAPQDIESFIWGYLCSNYPSGFHYKTACSEDATKCNFVIEETLNVTKLSWTDESALTESMKQHMYTAFTPHNKKLDSIKKYQEDFSRLQHNRVIINEGSEYEIAITLKTPNTAQYLEQGHRWIGGLVDSVNTAMGLDADINDRNSQINKLNLATTLCQYMHWIDSIEVGEVSGNHGEEGEPKIAKITDPATLMDTLKSLSSTDSIREAIIKKVLDYISHSTTTVIGVPTFNCPMCGKEHGSNHTYPRHTSIIPLDLIQVFFALLGRRLDRIVSKQLP